MTNQSNNSGGRRCVAASAMCRAAVFALLVGATGCQDPVFRERQDVRDQRIEHLFATIPEMDRIRAGNMNQVLQGAEELRQQRIVHLEQTISYAEELEQRREDRWRREPFYDEFWFHTISTGHPEYIHRTWADMVY